MREQLYFTPDEEAEERKFFDLYGPWEALDVGGVRDFFDGFDKPWWLVGGWAIEAFTGALREHEDIDVSLLACDVSALREFVGDRWHLWTNVSGRLRPLTDQWPDLPEPDCQIWVRRNAASPWVLDIVLTPDADGLWRSKRDPDHIAPLDDVTWMTDDGIRVASPEIVLLFKAAAHRRKDHRDLARAWPLLDERQQSWLLDAVRRLYPDHPWLTELGTDGVGTTDR